MPLPKRWMATIRTIVDSPHKQGGNAAKVRAEASPPPNQLPATGSSDRPVTVITEPITTGIKKWSMRLNQGPTSR